MNAFTVGGTIRATFTLAGELAKRHDVEIVSVYRVRAAAPALPVPKGVRLRTLTDLRTGARRTALQEWLRARRSRLISPQDYRYENFSLLTDAGLLRFLASVRDGVLVGTRPGLNLAIAHLAPDSVVRVGQDHVNLASYSSGMRMQMTEAYDRLDLLSTLTERDAAAYRELLGDRPPVELFPNPAPDLGGRRASLDDKVVIAAGRLAWTKGFDRLLPAWARIAERHPGWELRIFGDGAEREALQGMIDELGIAGSARLMGFTGRLHDELARASVYVMTSRQEGFPMVLLEAMAAGLPVVSVDCHTGPRDIVTDGVDGRIVPEEDEDALVEAVDALLADATTRRAYGAAALEAAARYEPSAIAARWEARLGELSEAERGRSTIAGPALRVLHGRVRRKVGG
ncbi:MAG TPA: glycosyltransferase family 4 protein [Solirubrobacteraceae bacterium]|nr:glycosyltransferase family 4 protein [Solirubrobacteraceae bacterium]